MAGLDMAQLTLRDLWGIQSETPEEFSLSQCGGTYVVSWGFPGGLVGLIPGSGRSLGEWQTHSSVLAWRIPWTEAPGALEPMGS